MHAKPLAPPIVETNPTRPPWMSGSMALVEDGWAGTLEDSANGKRLVGPPDYELAEFPAGPSDEVIASFIDELSRKLVNTGRKHGVPPPPPPRKR